MIGKWNNMDMIIDSDEVFRNERNVHRDTTKVRVCKLLHPARVQSKDRTSS